MVKRLEVIYGDITEVKFDAIVNAANSRLLKGGGVCGAIHRAAGDELEDECLGIGGCPTGEARITKSYGLGKNNIWWVIHAVGPIWYGGSANEQKLLENAYFNSLKTAVDYKEIYLKQWKRVIKEQTSRLHDEERITLVDKLYKEAEDYVNSHKIRTVAFPSISTGIYEFPLDKASQIAVSAIKKFLNENEEIEKVAIICFDRETFDYYNNEINKI
ncbi:MAG: macro domain-containing protein [Clostridiaceae bacterium]